MFKLVLIRLPFFPLLTWRLLFSVAEWFELTLLIGEVLNTTTTTDKVSSFLATVKYSFAQVLWDCSGQKFAPHGAVSAFSDTQESWHCSFKPFHGSAMREGTTSGPCIYSKFVLLWYSYALVEILQAYSSIPGWSKIPLLWVEEPRSYRLQKSLKDDRYNLRCRNGRNA